MPYLNKIIIDSREQDRLKSIHEHMKSFKLTSIPEISQEQLDYGDYVFIDDKNNEILRVEYKTISDFVSTITEPRFINQSYNLTQYPNPMFIVTGDFKSYIDQNEISNSKMIYGALSSIISKGNSLVYTPSFKEALYIMIKTAEKILEKRDGKLRRFNYIEKSHNAAFDFLCIVPNIGEVVANKIVEKLKLKSLQDLFDLTIDDLVTVDKVGEVKATSIIKAIKG